MDESLEDGMLSVIVDDALVENFKSSAVLLVTPLGDSIGYRVVVCSLDGGMEFGRASAETVSLAISLACARATANLQEAMEDEAAETASHEDGESG